MNDYEINKATVALATAIVLSTAILATLALKARDHKNASKVDKTTLCLVGQPLTHHTHIIVDKTDYYTEAQLAFIRQRVEEIKNGLAVNELFSLSFITSEMDGYTKIKPIFSACAPPKAEEANPLYENPRMIRQRFEKGFEAPFRQIFTQLERQEEYSTSPIIQTLEAATDLTGFQDERMQTRLILFSDGLENSGLFSDYQQSGEAPRRLPHFSFSKSTEVVFHYLIRPQTERLQTEANREFWRLLFVEAGVADPKIIVTKRF